MKGIVLAGVRDILTISTPEDQASFKRLFDDCGDRGAPFTRAVQPNPDGLAPAFIIGESFVAGHKCALILGGSNFRGHGLTDELKAASERRDAQGYSPIR